MAKLSSAFRKFFEGTKRRLRVVAQALYQQQQTVVAVSELVAALAVVVTTVFVWQEMNLVYESVQAAVEARLRPALLFSEEVSARIVERETGWRVEVSLEVRNQGSGAAYAVRWYEEDQIPPLHSELVTKEQVFESYENARVSIVSPVRTAARNMIIGAGLSHQVKIYHESDFPLADASYEVKKYVAAFYEEEGGGGNASIVGVGIRIEPGRGVTATVEDLVIVRDPRRRIR